MHCPKCGGLVGLVKFLGDEGSQLSEVKCYNCGKRFWPEDICLIRAVNIAEYSLNLTRSGTPRVRDQMKMW